MFRVLLTVLIAAAVSSSGARAGAPEPPIRKWSAAVEQDFAAANQALSTAVTSAGRTETTQAASPSSRYLVTVESQEAVEKLASELGNYSDKTGSFSAKVLFVETRQPAALLSYLKSHPKVLFVEEWSGIGEEPVARAPIVPFNFNAQLTHNVPLLRQRYGLTGNGVTVGVWDGGPVLAEHVEFGDRVNVKDAGQPHPHATHVAGTIGAAGIEQQAGGMAPKVNILSYSLVDDLRKMEQADPRPQISNHSYGQRRGWDFVPEIGRWVWFGDARVSDSEDYRFGKYATISAAIDDIAARNPTLCIFVAAGNKRAADNDPNSNPRWDGTHWEPILSGYVKDRRPADFQHEGGYDTLEGYAVAKNVITVGAIQDAPLGAIRVSPDLVKVTEFSSWGPADDGRVKPDLVANGAQLYSPTVQWIPTGYDRRAYEYRSGTSMATPTAAGIGALLVELSQAKRGKSLRSDEMRAALIHTAVSPDPGPSYQIGWGAIDAEAAGTLVAGESGMLMTASLPTGQPFRLKAEAAGGKIRATLAWIDPAGKPNAGGLNDRERALVLDLDLVLIDSAGNRYYPWSLDPEHPAAPATRSRPNDRDNVERIDIENGTASAGDWIIEVVGPKEAEGRSFVLALSGLKPR